MFYKRQKLLKIPLKRGEIFGNLRQLKNIFRVAVLEPGTNITQSCWQEMPAVPTAGQHIKVTVTLNRRAATFRHTEEQSAPLLPYVLHHQFKPKRTEDLQAGCATRNGLNASSSYYSYPSAYKEPTQLYPARFFSF